MTPTFGLWALLLVLVYCAWQLTQIRRLARGCYVELSTARWEAGRSGRAKDNLQSLPPVRRQGQDLTK